ncbi:sensor histidine kinase [Roseofilum casamattae]|uniref:histidine kinase n=1 Tax=Roseofilum casamattae BLCC-M143 TaxID=3022442 RepID=A0ABT7BY39_9CYAN|nr:ATP-binding protein [Roseofilum casamattae]MDJ1183366.1 ATP-binding protein [Roseofilum casamattae BLCC-M143]
MVSSPKDVLEHTKNLEKENRILRKKLQRSEKNCLELEATNDKRESLLRTVISELEEKRKLEQTLIELRRNQIQLIQTEKMSSLGKMVAGIAHEINNPVNFISGNIDYINDYCGILMAIIQRYQQCYPEPVPEIEQYCDDKDLGFLQDDLPKILKSVKLGVRRISDIVVSLKNFSRMDQSESKLVNIHEGIDSALAILQHRLKEHPNNLAIKVIRNYGDLPQIECYPGKLNQVLMNILTNAIDALEEDWSSARADESERTIVIATSAIESDRIEIRIADNANGIPNAIQSQIFDPFFTTKPIGQGTGMGLAISHHIINELHKGQLTFNSRVGVGTEFSIQIPTACARL